MDVTSKAGVNKNPWPWSKPPKSIEPAQYLNRTQYSAMPSTSTSDPSSCSRC